MIRLFRTLLARRPTKSAENDRSLGLTLASIEGSLLDDSHFPRPQWKIIRAWIKDKFPEEKHEQAWREIVRDWLGQLKSRLDKAYIVTSSPNFLLLTTRNRTGAQSIHRTCETAVQLLTAWLGKAAEKQGFGKHVILDFATIEQYYDYISYFYPPDSHSISSGGVFLNDGYKHIALPPHNRVQSTMIHELAHNRLSHLSLPLWLEEGIAVTTERRIGGEKGGILDREVRRMHADHWNEQSIATFWDGSSFRNPEGEISRLSYSLAEILVDLMVQEFPNFMEFVSAAKSEDAGQSAAISYLGVDLNDIAGTFLGPGNWTSSLARPKKRAAQN